MWSQCFTAQASPDARVLILGSMPGQVSLAQSQYYAHPRNLFWIFMQTLFDIDKCLSYDERILALKAQKIALWDVYAECYREGSLDVSITASTIRCNDFVSFFKAYPNIHTIFFNGKAAEKAYKKHILPLMPVRHCQYIGLPSSSPANASISYEDKLQCWQKVQEVIRHAR
jgi:hypoxanthine-DNA glycosylase